MKCNIIDDLLNLYVDDLCSKESNDLVEKHIKSCSKCHEKYELLLKEKNKDLELEKTNSELEKEANKIKLKPFAKLRKKLLFRCILDVILIILTLVCVISVVGYSYCVITKEDGTQDIDTYLAGRKAIKITEKIINGNADIIFDELTYNSSTYHYIKNNKEFEKDIIKALKDEYSNNFKGKDLKINVNNSTFMSDSYNDKTEKCISTFVNVTANNGDSMNIWFKFDNLYKYSIHNISYEPNDSDTDNTESTFKNIAYLFQVINNNLPEFRLHIDYNLQQYITKLDEDYKTRKALHNTILLAKNNKNDKTFKHLVALFDKGVKIDNCSISNYTYDTKTKHINADLILLMSNDKNNVWTIKHPIYYNTINSDYQNLPYSMFCDDTDSEVFGDIPKDIKLNALKKIFR